MREDSNQDDTQSFVPLTKGNRVGRYKIVDKIGAGGMGEVYLAEDTELDRKVALKFLAPGLCQDEECRARFKREAQAAAKLDHPNIVTVHEVSEYKSRPFFAMQHISGQSLRGVIREKERSVLFVIDLVIQICEGLRKAHEAGVVHRDVKPSNILIDSDGRPKLLDFGLATIKGAEKLTKTGSTLGTVGYMSPEQVRGDDVDARSDLFSLGVILYEMITGKAPFTEEYEAATMTAILQKTPEPLRRFKADVPDSLQTVVDKALDKDVETRYQTAAGMLADLKRVRKELAPEVEAPSYFPASLRKRSKPVLVIGAVSLVAVIAVAGYFVIGLLPVARKPHADRPDGTVWENSIAVLPFRDFSPKGDQEYFCDGITDALIGKLSGLKDLKVISMSSVMRYKAPDRDIRKIGQELGVDKILEGSIQKEENRIRVTAQLINADDDAHLWSDTYDRETESIFAVQDDISRAIVNVMKIALFGEEEVSFARRYTENVEAYNLYMRGRYLWRKRIDEHIRTAIEYFKQAIELDSNYAMAYAGLADAWSVLPGYSDYPEEEAAPKAKEAALKALALDDNLAEAHASLGLTLDNEEKYEEAEQKFKRAIELNPGYVWAHTWYSSLLRDMGRRDEGLKELEIAYELDPINIVTILNLAMKKRDSREWDDAEELYKRALEIEPNPRSYSRYAEFLYYVGRTEDVIAVYSKAIEEFPKSKDAYLDLAYTYANAGDIDNAMQTIDRYADYATDEVILHHWRGDIFLWSLDRYDEALGYYNKALEIRPDDPDVLYDVAALYSIVGDFKGALETANKYVELKPEEPWPYVWRGEINRRQGNFKRAFEDFKKALKMNPDDYSARWDMIIAYLYTREFNRAEKLIDGWISGNVNVQSQGRFFKSVSLTMQGKFEQALPYIDSCIVADSTQGSMYWVFYLYKLKMFIYEEMGDLDMALEQAEKMYETCQEAMPYDKFCYGDYLIKILAEKGRFERAEKMAEDLKSELEGAAELTGTGFLSLIRGIIEFSRGNLEASVRHYKQAADSIRNPFVANYFQNRLMLARAYLESGRYNEAIKEYESLLSNYGYGRFEWPIHIAKAHYHLAMAYEKSGNNKEAIKQFREFLEAWKDGDPDIAAVKDARNRLELLEEKT
ncbi:MAG: tetratricopeptide repeat protein [Candidatus Zixiibacteriota bacterium]|nr:MAG: tetratricopeptide repeat protein [candidate division Zixibacteria bacterium]